MVKSKMRGAGRAARRAFARGHSKNLLFSFSLHDQVQQAVLHPDGFHALLTFQPASHNRLGFGRRHGLILRRSSSNLELAAHLPRNLHGYRRDLLHRELRVERGPTRHEKAFCSAELLVQFLGEVRRNGMEKRDERAERRGGLSPVGLRVADEPGGVRAEIRLKRGSSEKDAVAAAEAEPALARWLEGKQRVKTIWVQDRLLNLVVK